MNRGAGGLHIGWQRLARKPNAAYKVGRLASHGTGFVEQQPLNVRV